MAGLRLTYLTLTLVSCYIQSSYGIGSLEGHAQGSGNPYYRTLPCPNPEDIAPCTCTYVAEDQAMDMDCINVADEEELHQVFHSLIPIPTFRELYLPTDRLTTLSENVFGEATFENVIILCSTTCDATLTTVGPNTFKKSVSTLRSITIGISNISEFPYDTIGEYINLDTFVLNNSPLLTFPVINSDTLQTLILNHDSFREIPAHALDGLPNLTDLTLVHNNYDSIAKDVFASLPILRSIAMVNGAPRHLHSRQFAIYSNNLETLTLQSNGIEDIDPDTFTGVQSGRISLDGNKLTTLQEATWKPLLAAGVELQFGGSDLTCGCDVAWIVLEPAYHPLVVRATCHSGESLVDLDPTFFENFC